MFDKLPCSSACAGNHGAIFPVRRWHDGGKHSYGGTGDVQHPTDWNGTKRLGRGRSAVSGIEAAVMSRRTAY